MRTPSLPRTLFAFLLVVLAVCRASADTWQPLFNGKDLNGWNSWMGVPAPEWNVPGMKRDAAGKYSEPIGPNRDPLRVFTVEQQEGQPVLHVSGQGFGPLTTTKSFSNYHFRLQYKWGQNRFGPKIGKPRDTGLLYHVHGKNGELDGTWPRGVELQIQEHDTGDLWTLLTHVNVRARPKQGDDFAIYDPAQPEVEFALYTSQNSSRCRKLGDFEKPFGEWNSVDLIVLGDQSIHVVNGHVVMRLAKFRTEVDGHWVPLTSGAIALQTEGGEVFFRRVEIRPITKVPAEFRE